jgi:hypothetical protein
MPNGISYNFLKESGVMINIPDNYREVTFTKLDEGDIGKYPGNNIFNPDRIAINFTLTARKDNQESKICIPATVFVFIEQEDLKDNATLDDLKIADWDGSSWNVLVLNLERWQFRTSKTFNGKDYIGYIKADACIPGDPPIAVGR